MADYAIHEETLFAQAEILRKKFGTSDRQDPADYPAKMNLMGALEEKTVSGSVATFSDGADDVPLKSSSFGILASGGGGTPSTPVPIVGKSSVTVYQTGKNLFDKANPNVVSGYIDANSFNTGNTNAKTVYIPIKGGETYTVSKTAGQRFWIATSEVIPSSGALYTNRKVGNTASSIYVTAGDNDKYLWAWVFMQGTDTGTLEDMLSSVQIELGSTGTTYEAYKSKTPITVALGQTVYGGTLAEDGTLTITHALVPFSDCTWASVTSYQSNFNSTNGIVSLRFGKNAMASAGYAQKASTSLCNIFDNQGRSVWNNIDRMYEIGYTDGISFNVLYSDIGMSEWTSDATTIQNAFRTSSLYSDGYITLELAMPIVITGLDEISLSTYLGDNSIWCDSGNTEIVYRSSGTQTLIPPTLISKTITENGTYSAEDDNADGYDEVTVNVSSGGGNTPEATQTLICDNSSLGSTLTFTDDYENYDLIKFVVYRSDVQNTFVFYATPAMINACCQYSSNHINFNQPYGNNFVCYTKSSNTSWTRYGVRNLAVQYVYGLTFTNCTVAETEFYNRQAIGSSAVTFTPPTGESFLDYDYILFMTCTGNSDETQVNLEVFQPGIEKDIFGSTNTKQNTVTVYRYNTGGTVATVTENTITSYQYFYACGLKLNFNQQNLLSGSLNSSNSEEEENENELGG